MDEKTRLAAMAYAFEQDMEEHHEARKKAGLHPAAFLTKLAHFRKACKQHAPLEVPEFIRVIAEQKYGAKFS